MTMPLLTHSKINALAVLKIEGNDAATFLQSQLSQDIQLVTNRQAFLACYCSPQGRVLTTLLLWQGTENTYYALLPKDNATFIQQRLNMFILRANVAITLEEVMITAIWGEHIERAASHFIKEAHFATSVRGTLSFQVDYQHDVWAITYPSATTIQRLLLIHSPTITHIPIEPSDNEEHWFAQDIKIGLPWIGHATKEKFIAQTINQDVLGAINFKKGCYPGQEVIARSHYRGRLKRRSIIGTVPLITKQAHTLIGTTIMREDEPIGEVINAANTEESTYILFEIQLNYLLNDSVLSLDTPPYPTITYLDMPYALEKPA